MDPGDLPHARIDPTDVLALVVMVVMSLRRFNVKVAEAGHFPGVPPQRFAEWRQRALDAYTLGIRACFLKFTLNTLWYYGARGLGFFHAAGGALVFVGWVVAMVVVWYRSGEARRRQAELGIELRGRPRDSD